MKKIAICDDNSIQVDMLEEILQEYILDRKEDAVVDKYCNGQELLTYVKQNGFYDLYILDMIMPGINGLELASTLRALKDEGKIIFLTSTVEYAVSSYDVKAFYYMLKPLDVHKMYSVLDDALKEISSNEKMLILKQGTTDIRIKINDVVYVDIVSRCPCYHLKDGRVFTDRVVRGTFREAINVVAENENFFFCGVGLAININYVDAVDSDSVLLTEGTLLYPSKSGIVQFKKQIKQIKK